MMAHRQTYHQDHELPYNFTRSKLDTLFDGYSQSYTFQDTNLKLNLEDSLGNFIRISYLRGNDVFDIETIDTIENRIAESDFIEDNDQRCLSFIVHQNIKSQLSHSLHYSWSTLDYQVLVNRLITTPRGGKVLLIDRDDENNLVSHKYSYQMEYRSHSIGDLLIEVGGLVSHLKLNEDVYVRKDSLRTYEQELSSSMNRFTTAVEHKKVYWNRYELNAGLLLNVCESWQNIYIDPRLSIVVKVSDNYHIKAAYEKHHQFIVKQSVIDESGSYQYIWNAVGCNGEKVLASDHFVLGANFQNQRLLLSLEAYHKYTTDLSRYHRTFQVKDIYSGVSKSSGIDCVAGVNFGKHIFNMSYTRSTATERFDYYSDNQYKPAAYDQKHELKTLFLFQLKALNLSLSYIYGSGFNDQSSESIETTPYHRCDVSASYKLQRKAFQAEVGISLLNLFDAENQSYNSLSNIPQGQHNQIFNHSASIGFTPMFSLKLKYN